MFVFFRCAIFVLFQTRRMLANSHTIPNAPLLTLVCPLQVFRFFNRPLGLRNQMGTEVKKQKEAVI